jgi:hypothetical protein
MTILPSPWTDESRPNRDCRTVRRACQRDQSATHPDLIARALDLHDRRERAAARFHDGPEQSPLDERNHHRGVLEDAVGAVSSIPVFRGPKVRICAFGSEKLQKRQEGRHCFRSTIGNPTGRVSTPKIGSTQLL